jgi:hypothetical protein
VGLSTPKHFYNVLNVGNPPVQYETNFLDVTHSLLGRKPLEIDVIIVRLFLPNYDGLYAV